MSDFLKVKVGPTGICPKKGTVGSAGYDLFTPEELVLTPGLHTIDLDIQMALPANTYGDIRCRSSLAKKHVSIEAGVVDSDYRGNIKVLLRTRDHITLKKGHAVAQMLILPLAICVPKEVNSLDNTERGDKGFGSTD
jgi:dUTP pyrophosphatase